MIVDKPGKGTGLEWVNLSSNKDLNSIVVRGTKIALGTSDGDFYRDESKLQVISGNKYQHMRFGVQDSDGHQNFFVFAQGKATKTMPTFGTAIYKGDAIGNYKSADDDFTTGKSRLEVNFGQSKSVHGTLSNWENSKMPTITFNATIHNNRFSGDGAKGQFFGPNATEVGGVIFKTVKINGIPTEAGGSFGAIKQ